MARKSPRKRNKKRFFKKRANKGGIIRRAAKAFFGRRLIAHIILLINVIVLTCGGIWFMFQPAERKREITQMLVHCFDGKHRHVKLTHVVWDIWSLYHSDQYVKCDVQSENSSVYGGAPVARFAYPGGMLQLLENTAYCVGYDNVLRSPAWAAYRLKYVSDADERERPGQFDVDRRTIARVSSDDYTGSGFDRGHLAPNYGIAKCFGEKAQRETFLMSNIVPQRHALNAGNWKTLEMREANDYIDRFEEVWVITGPVFSQKGGRQLPGGIPIPVAFYKIIIDEIAGRVRTQAFLFRHDGAGDEKLETLLVSVDEIEKLTGLDFFPQLPEDVQKKLESETAAHMW